MGATTSIPTWLAIIVAVAGVVITPAVTLVGVWLTQLASDRRATTEAEFRLQAQREEHLADRRFEAYTQALDLLDKRYTQILRIFGSVTSGEYDKSDVRQLLSSGVLETVQEFAVVRTQLRIVGNRDANTTVDEAHDIFCRLTDSALENDRRQFGFIVQEFTQCRQDFIRAIRKDWGIAEELRPDDEN